MKRLAPYFYTVFILSLFTTVMGGGLTWTWKEFLMAFGVTTLFWLGMLAPLIPSK
jgi:hypothetical protein